MLLEIPVVLTQGLEGGKEMRGFLLLESSRKKKIWLLFPVTDFFLIQAIFKNYIRELFSSSVKSGENKSKEAILAFHTE